MTAYKRFIAALSAAAILTTSVGVTSFAKDGVADGPLVEIVPVEPDPGEITEEAEPSTESTRETAEASTEETAESTEETAEATDETAESTEETAEGIDYSAYLKDEPIPVYPSLDDGSEYVPNYMPEYAETLDRGNASSSYYNLAKEGRVSDVRNQNPWGTCWAHAALASAESNMITKGYANTTVDYSEAHLAWFGTGPGPSSTSDPLYGDSRGSDSMTAADAYDAGGLWYDSIGALSRWSGAELESVVPYSVALSSKAPAESTRYDSYATLVNATVYDDSDVAGIKNCLVNNGAMQVSYLHSNSYYNSSTSAYYCNQSGTNHAVTLVGWDDNYAVSNFRSDCRPSSKGAWIIKNSWGSGWGDDGYFYISYEDASITKFVSYEMEKKGTYNKLYQYDGSLGMSTSGNYIYFDGYKYMSNSTSANVFTATASDPLSAVGFYTTAADVQYKVTVFTGVSSTPNTGKVAYTTSGTMARAGYHTVKVSGVNLTKGQKFAVAVTLYGYATHCYDKYNGQSGISYKCSSTSPESATSWTDTKSSYGSSPCIKAYTKAAAVVKPANVKATAVVNGAKITWNAVSGATKYKVVLKNAAGTIVSRDGVTGTSYTWGGLVGGAQYSFTVTAYVNNAWTAFGDWSTVNAAVAAPTNVKATSTNGNVNITWTAVANTTKYKVVLKNAAGTIVSRDGVTGTSYTWTGLTTGATYNFCVMAYNNGVWSAISNWSQVTVAASKPANVKATAVVNGAKITWNAVSGATKYKVVLKNAAGTIVSRDGVTGTSYTWGGLVGGAQYSFTVTAYVNNAWTAFGDWSTVNAAVAAPTNVKATSTNGNVNITWTAVANTTKYKVVLKNSAGTIVSRDGVTGTSYTWTGLTAGASYGFCVMAYNNGVWSAISNWSQTTVIAPKPANVKATAVVNGAKITWNAVSGATKYKVVLKNAAGTIVSRDGVTGTSYTWGGLVGGAQYSFTVTAYVNNSWSAFGDWSTVKTAVATPVMTSAASTKSGTATIKWNSVSGATKYKVVLRNALGTIVSRDNVTATTYDWTGLVTGATYDFTVIAYNNGVWSAFGSWRSVKIS